MTVARVTTIGLGSALLATWLVSAAVTWRGDDQDPPRPRSSPPRTGRAEALPDIEVSTDRLLARLERIPAPRRPTRNPFRFETPAPRTPPASETVRAAAIVEEPARPADHDRAPAPRLRLVAIAEDRTAAGPARLAAIVVGDTLMLVRVGDLVEGRYLVAAIAPDVVELRDQTGGPPIRLALREQPPL